MKRGCRQRSNCPLPTYAGAEIFSHITDKSVSIKGINTGKALILESTFTSSHNYYYTIILDGHVNSLQATLNILEKSLGAFSGLRRDTGKTKLIWTDSKKIL